MGTPGRCPTQTDLENEEFTVLTAAGDDGRWSTTVFSVLERECGTRVFHHKRHLHAIILLGAIARESIERALGTKSFSYGIVAGASNVKLPFRPQLL